MASVIRDGTAEEVQHFIEQHGFFRTDRYGLSPLYYDARYGDLDLVKDFFVQEDEVVNQMLSMQDPSGTAPLFCAVQCKRWNVIEFLLERGAESEGNTLLNFAAGKGTTAKVRKYLDQNTDDEHRQYTSASCGAVWKSGHRSVPSDKWS